ncbi:MULTISPECIES: glycosyltransferase family 2 protein [Proteus]|uniref:Glycosyltransferase family 2 protein n=1 Tax=Proteus penneri TaxID=102862 RepID=A0ABS0W6B0_9GAMM|nr:MULTISPECIES: glycosyltransferase family 2 protein [Proteus]MBJ2118818.1 glycosyltransferase family 2 protein [Proteus penneri]NBM77708.1 glycosyltransferase [Proteus sp. G2659]
MKKNISVIIPYYNDSNSITRCLTSIKNQTIQAKEIIIIDDNSNDTNKLKSIINNFPLENIIYNKNTRNMNAAFSRNLGFTIASGDYIALLDADDYWEKEHLEKSLENLKMTNADFIFSNVIEEISSNNYRYRKVTNPYAINNKFDILFYSPPQTNSFFFKKNITTSIKFDESLKRHQDYQFLISILSNPKYKTVYVDQYTSYYCISTRSFSSRIDLDSMFRFWEDNQSLFTAKLLEKKIISLINLSYKIDTSNNILMLKKKYPFLKKIENTFYFRIYNIIKDKNLISKKILTIIYLIKYKLITQLICKK